MNASDSRSLALPKPRQKTKVVKRLQVRRRIVAQSAKRRKEQPVIAKVRAACVERDVYCRLAPMPWVSGVCDGPSEWAHMHEFRRAATRRMAPTARHSTAGSLMLCRKHHQDYDQHRLDIDPDKTCGRGADGVLIFSRRVPNRVIEA